MCAFYQILLSKVTMKYCGVATLFRGVRVYTKVIHGNAWIRDYCGNIIVASWATSSRRDVTAKLADVCLPQSNNYRGWNFFARCTLSWPLLVSLHSLAVLLLSLSRVYLSSLAPARSLAVCYLALLPHPSNQLWIVTDGSVTKCGLGRTI